IAPATLSIVAVVWLVAVLVFILPAEEQGPLSGGLIALQGHQFSVVTGENWSSFVLEWGRVIAFGPPCALLVYAFASLDADGKMPISRSLSVVGDWSYALYLSHILVLAAIARVLPAIAAGPFFALVALPAVLLVAGLTYTLVERPLMNAFSRWRKSAFQDGTHVPRPSPIAARIW
ncbi:MAG: hypothetical protein AAFQ22_16040, partial [Pseudomonadota bacterium]